MITYRLSIPPASRWPLLAAVALVGCTLGDAPAPGGPRLPDLAGGRATAPAPLAIAPTPVPAPQPRPDLPWDSCNSQDPNPWPWRSDAEGKWGENPASVPAFTYKQERRAPKMPDADRYMNDLGRTSPKEVLDSPLKDALLICHVETYSHHGMEPTFYRYKLQRPNPTRHTCGSDWDSLNGPDVLLRFRFRDEYPISLFGPEDHWGFFISIPSIALTVGDPLAVKLWDRDAGTYFNGNVNERRNEYMGEARMKFDGTLPFTLHSEYFTMRCSAMRTAQTHARAQSWIDQLDHQLKVAQDWRPEPNRWDYGANGAADRVDDEFGRGIFRYPAGFLGWDAPEIQSRLPLVAALAGQDARKRRERTTELTQKAPPATAGDYRLDGNHSMLHIAAAQCSSGACTVQAQVGARLLKDLCTQVPTSPVVRAAGIDDSGKFTAAIVETEQEGVWKPCHEDPIVEGTTAVHLKLPSGSVLLWLGGVGKATIFKLPVP